MKKSKKSSSRSFKLATWSFIISIILVALGVVEEITVGNSTIKLRAIDPLIILTLTGPAFSLYGFRRYTEARYYRKELSD